MLNLRDVARSNDSFNISNPHRNIFKKKLIDN